jgi:hypothetical protein
MDMVDAMTIKKFGQARTSEKLDGGESRLACHRFG